MNQPRTHHHEHYCAICGLASPWCCRHKWTIGYIAVVVSLLLIVAMLEASGWLP